MPTIRLYDDIIGFLARLTGEPRPFHLIRDDDVNGQSGIGVIAEGLAWPNGHTLMRWLSDTPTITAYPHVTNVETIHGHDERTYIEWLDNVPRRRWNPSRPIDITKDP